jgi:hypothetical protein
MILTMGLKNSKTASNNNECSIRVCHHDKSKFSDFCLKHRCPVLIGQQRCVMPSRYTKGSCIEHQCMHESCSTTTKNIGSCCQKHSCSIFGCNKKRDNTTFFCVDHKCVHSGCTYGIFCNETHICSFPACEVIVYGKIINCLHHTITRGF